jgi:hypothetical protein
MERRKQCMAALLIAVALALSACSNSTGEDQTLKVQPAKVEKLLGTGLQRVVLTAKAAERIGIKTAPVRELSRNGGDTPQKVVEYDAVIYDTNGDTYVFTNPEPLVFVRQPVTVDSIEGDLAVLSDGPPLGTAVVTVGTPELYGIDAGIGGNE